jgi:hypothetical protein
MEDDNQPMMGDKMEGDMEKKDSEKKSSKKSSEPYKSSEESWQENPVWVPRLEKEDENAWLVGYDFFLNMFMRFDTSFVIILILENISFGLFVLVTLSA